MTVIRTEEGHDIAHHQRTLNVSPMVAAGRTFIFIKTTEGYTWIDPKHKEFIDTVVAGSDMDWGPYHFFRPRFDPILQARHMFEVVQAVGHTPTLEWAVDVEVTDGLQNWTVDRRLRQFLNELIRLGVPVSKIAIYTRKTFFDKYVSVDVWYAQFVLWVAHYGTLNPWIPSSWVKGGKPFKYHQYTSKHPGGAYGVGSTYIDGDRRIVTGPSLEDRVEALEEMVRILASEHGMEF